MDKSDLEAHKRSVKRWTDIIERNDKNDKPAVPSTYRNRSYAYIELGEYLLAISDLDKMIELDPKSFIAYNERGYSYDMIGRYDLALLDYSEAVKLNPNDSSAFNNRGHIYKDCKEYEKAEKDLLEAIRIEPDDACGYAHIGDLYRLTKRYDLALESINSALVFNPKYTRCFYYRGMLFYEQKKYEDSENEFRKVIESGTTDTKLLNQAKESLSLIHDERERFKYFCEGCEGVDSLVIIFHDCNKLSGIKTVVPNILLIS